MTDPTQRETPGHSRGMVRQGQHVPWKLEKDSTNNRPRAINGIEERSSEEDVHIPETARSKRDGYRSIDYRRKNHFDERRKVFQVQEARAP